MGFHYILNPPRIAIWDVAPFSGPLTSLFKLCHWGENGPAAGVRQVYIK